MDTKNNDNLSPEEKTSWLGQTFYTYVTPLINLGKKKILEFSDLPELSKKDKPELIYMSASQNWQHTKESGKPSLLKALFATYGWEFFWAGVFKWAQDMFVLVTPILLNLQIKYLEDENADITMGLVYTLLMFLNALGQSYMNRCSYFMLRRMGMNIKCLLTTLIYDKTLHLSSASRMKYQHGDITDMMEVDTDKLRTMTAQLHMIWSGPNTLILSMIILCFQVGWAAFAGLMVILIMFPISRYISTKLKYYQKAMLKAKDVRLRITTEILTGIKTIKIQAWEPSFLKKIEEARKEELRLLKIYAFLQTLHSTIWQSTNIIVSVVTFGIFALLDGDLTVSTAFTCISCFNIIRAPINIVPSVINNIIESNVSLKRMEDFLLTEEYVPVQEGSLTAPGILIENATMRWPKYSRQVAKETKKSPKKEVPEESVDLINDSFELKNINIYLEKGQLLGVTGKVGQGKSSLINAILGELQVESGSIYRKGSISYVSQLPFIMNATLKDNIIFGHSFDEEKYHKALEVSALLPDLEILPAGDQTEIGEKGINLSGGQKMRVSLARAYYLDNDIYLLDDPLSAVDSHVSNYLFNNLVMDLKNRGKTVIFVTHAIDFLKYCDKTAVIDGGEIRELGSFTELSVQEGSILKELINAQEQSKVTKTKSAEEEEEEEDGDSVTLDPRGKLVLKKSSLKRMKKAISEKKEKESIETSPLETGPETKSEDNNKDKDIKTTETIESGPTPQGKLVKEEEREKGRVPFSVYSSYIHAAGGYAFFIFVMFCFIFTELLKVASSYWLTIWSNSNGEHPMGFYVGIYTLLGFGAVILYVCRYIFTYIFGLKASKVLHQNTINTVIHLPMSFFDKTPMGRVVNRFSKDIYTIDKTLPNCFTDVGNTFMNVVSTILVIVISTPIFIVALIPIAFYYMYQQQVYVKTSREVKRIESITRSPVYAFFSETIDGMYSIRAYNSQSIFTSNNNQKLTNNQKAYFVTVATNCWLSLRLELVGNLVVTAASLAAVIAKIYKGSDFAGIALTEVETQIVSVERLHQYSDLKEEAPYSIPEHIPRETWPEMGNIDIEDLVMRYRPELEPVLHHLSLHINSKEKVGVVGRTGAGKSSILMALLRLVPFEEGKILIDGVDITSIGVGDLRKKIAVIPQEPMLFSGSIRYNMDPFNQYTDAQIWDILEMAQMKDTIKDLPGMLSYEIQERGENFSVGQRQLLCLARAILNNCKIIFLDEATASIDIETDLYIQTIIKKVFKNSTVITIAHRIHTILDSDKILVLDAGQVKEYDEPKKLLDNPNSMFSGFVNVWQEGKEKTINN
ncbi:hypothetical protein WA158_001868 [Blastocystis sp. Blastoise]